MAPSRSRRWANCPCPCCGTCTNREPFAPLKTTPSRPAQPFYPLSLMVNILWDLEDPPRRRQLGMAARLCALWLCDPLRLAGLYVEVYVLALEWGIQKCNTFTPLHCRLIDGTTVYAYTKTDTALLRVLPACNDIRNTLSFHALNPYSRKPSRSDQLP